MERTRRPIWLYHVQQLGNGTDKISSHGGYAIERYGGGCAVKGAERGALARPWTLDSVMNQRPITPAFSFCTPAESVIMKAYVLYMVDCVAWKAENHILELARSAS